MNNNSNYYSNNSSNNNNNNNTSNSYSYRKGTDPEYKKDSDYYHHNYANKTSSFKLSKINDPLNSSNNYSDNYKNNSSSYYNNKSKTSNNNNTYNSYNSDSYYAKDKKFRKKNINYGKHYDYETTEIITKPIANENENIALDSRENNKESNKDKDYNEDKISNVNINFNFPQKPEESSGKVSDTHIDNEERLTKLQNKIVTTSIVQSGLRDFFSKLRLTKNDKDIETNSNSINISNSNASPQSKISRISISNESLKKSFTDLKIINTDIFETTEKIFHEELKKRFNIMKSNSKNINPKPKKKLIIMHMLNIEYTDFCNKVEEIAFNNWSIATISFSLLPKRVKKEGLDLELEKYRIFTIIYYFNN